MKQEKIKDGSNIGMVNKPVNQGETASIKHEPYKPLGEKKNDANAISEIESPSMTGPAFAKVLGGLPEKITAEEVMMRNDPGAREAAPGSFRPESRGRSNNEDE